MGSGLGSIARADRLAGAHGVRLLDAAVPGTRQPAGEGRPGPLASGPREIARRVQPVLGAVAAKTIYTGNHIGQGTALKLACDARIASLTGSGSGSRPPRESSRACSWRLTAASRMRSSGAAR